MLNHGANDGIFNLAVVQIDADFVADLNSRFGSLATTPGNVRQITASKQHARQVGKAAV